MAWQGVTAGKASKYYYENDPIFNEDGQTQNIEWVGKQAEMLGVDNNTTKEEMLNILQGKSKDGETQLVQNERKNAAFDMTLAAHKEVSALGLMEGGDYRIIEAHNRAVNKAAEAFENNMAATRTRKTDENGNKERVSEKTGNALIGMAKHSTNRNNDLHLHTHMVIVNQTYDKNTDTFKALDMDFKNQAILQNTYDTEMAKEMKDLGYELEKRTVENEDGRSFETWGIKGFSEDMITAMSTRREDTKEQAEKLGIDKLDSGSMKLAAHTSKRDKDIDITKEELQDRAKSQLASVGKDINSVRMEALKRTMSGGKEESYFKSAEEVLKTAARDLSAGKARFNENELLNAGTKIALGDFSRSDLKEELDKVLKTKQTDSSDLKRLSNRDDKTQVFTTKEMNDKEKWISKEVGQKVQIGAIMSKEAAEKGLAAFEKENFTLTKGQKEAAMAILSSSNQLEAINGVAGSGKSTMLEAVQFSLKHDNNNTKVLVTSLSNKAVSGAVEASRMENGDAFKGKTLHNLVKQKGLEKEFGVAGKGNLEASDKIEKTHLRSDQNADKFANKERVEKLAKSMESIHLATGNKGFKKGGFSLDPKNKFNVNLDNASYSSSSRTLGGGRVHEKQTKVNRGEHKGSIKKERTTVTGGGDNIKYEATIKNNKGETFNQKIESHNFDNMRGLLISTQKRTVENAKGSTEEGKHNLMGLQIKTKKANTDYGNEKGLSGQLLGGLAGVERSTINQKRGENDSSKATTKFNLLGMSMKSVTETVKDKEGNVQSSITTKEKSFLGFTVGSATVIDNKNNSVETYDYSKKGDQVNIKEKESFELKDQPAVNEVAKVAEKEADLKSETKLLIIDEASMVSANDAYALLNTIKEEYSKGNEIKAVFMGDINQLQSVESGNVFQQMQEIMGENMVVNMDESQRQRNDLQKEVTDSASAKDIEKSINTLDNAGAIVEAAGFKDRVDAVVAAATKEDSKEFVDFKNETKTQDMDYKNTVILAATNKENKALNEGMRSELKDQGKITEEVNTKVNVGVLKDTLKQHNASNYEKDMKVQTFEGAAGMRKGTEYKVTDTDLYANTIKLKTVEADKEGKHGYTTVKAHDIAGKVTVNKEEDRQFGVGDKVRITETNKDLGVTNSDQGLIIGMNQKEKVATIDFGKEIGTKEVDLKEFKGIENGYAMTNHSAQGISVDRIVASFDTKENKSMNTMNSFYVALSRQKVDATLVVDNKETLKTQVSNEARNVSSLDNLEKEKPSVNSLQIDNKLSSEMKDKVEVANNKDTVRLEGKHVSYSEAAGKSNKAANERNEAKAAGNEEKFKDKQSEFMNQQVVARNGYSAERVENWANEQVETGRLSQENADNFVRNSNDNAKNLAEAGILEDKGNGDYKFSDSFAKQTLSENADQKMDTIAEKNLEGSIKAENKEPDLEKATQKIALKEHEIDKAIENGDSKEKIEDLKQDIREISKQHDIKDLEANKVDKEDIVNAEWAKSLSREGGKLDTAQEELKNMSDTDNSKANDRKDIAKEIETSVNKDLEQKDKEQTQSVDRNTNNR